VQARNSQARNSPPGESRDREGRVSRQPTWDEHERGQELTDESRDREGRVLVRAETERAGSAGDQHRMSKLGTHIVPQVWKWY
jgi:hypothetical protein